MMLIMLVEALVKVQLEEFRLVQLGLLHGLISLMSFSLSCPVERRVWTGTSSPSF